MGNRKIKPFSAFISEDIPPPMSPTNSASGANIAGLPPDFPPVPLPSQRKKSKIVKRKLPKT